MRRVNLDPTIRDVLQAAVEAPTDRLALMAPPPRPGAEIGIFVLIFGQEAIDDIGPVLIRCGEKLGLETGEHTYGLELSFDTPITGFFKWLHERGAPYWASGEITREGVSIIIFGVLGQAASLDLAGELAKRGFRIPSLQPFGGAT